MYVIDKLVSASIDEIKRGYVEESGHYQCLLCGEKTEQGVIYQQDGQFYDAQKYMKIHIEQQHKSVFHHLIALGKKYTGLSDHQNELLRLFYLGKSDAEVQKEMGIGSSSTIRNHRFVLREKERQAKVFLVLMELLKDGDKKSVPSDTPQQTARKMDSGGHLVPEEDRKKLLQKYFPFGPNGPLQTFKMKEKNKLVVLSHIVAQYFDPNRTYSEREVNEVLKGVYGDFVTLRRYLIEYGFLSRTPDGSQYWLMENSDNASIISGTNSAGVSSEMNVIGRQADKDENNETGASVMERKKELAQRYKDMKKEAGVYQIRNTMNQKILVIAAPDLKSINGRRFELNMGGYLNKQLQADWNQYGENAFEFEVLEVLKEKEEGFFDKKEELKKLEEKWLEKLQPYDDLGYNKRPSKKGN